jgi:general secretion pathway protein A
MLKHGESPQEFFDYKDHPFADTYRLKSPYLGEQDNRFLKTALSLIANGKSFTLYGPSGAGKSTLVHGCNTKKLQNFHKRLDSIIAYV